MKMGSKKGKSGHVCGGTRLTRPGAMSPLSSLARRACNAIQIARSSGAERYATETFQKAENDLKQAEAYRARNAGSKPVTMTARHAAQTAEDARAIAVKRQDDELLAAERQAGGDRESRAENGRAAAQSETDRVKRKAAEARLRAEGEAARIKRKTDAQTMAAQVEAARLTGENWMV